MATETTKARIKKQRLHHRHSSPRCEQLYIHSNCLCAPHPVSSKVRGLGFKHGSPSQPCWTTSKQVSRTWSPSPTGAVSPHVSFPKRRSHGDQGTPRS